MKTTKQILLAVAITAAFTLITDVSGAESARAASTPTNRALAASPRYLEEHPELLRVPQSVAESEIEATRIRKQLANLLENRALANSPRFREEHPEILRVPPTAEEAQASTARSKEQLAKLMKNRAWASSPRAREEFPALTRELTFGTARGGPSRRGATKLMESGK